MSPHFCISVRVAFFCCMMLQTCKPVICRKNDELRKDAVDALCCLAHALGEDFTIFIPSIHKLLLKHRLQVYAFTCIIVI
jgi:FKBP12-rapamycin complex-associated protein